MSNLKFDQVDFFFNTRTKFKDYLYLEKSPVQEDWFNQLNLNEDEQEKLVISRLINNQIVVFLSIVSANKDFENRLIRYSLVCKFELNDQMKNLMINLSYLMIKDKTKLLTFLDKHTDLIDPFFKETLSIDLQKQKLNMLKNRILTQLSELSFHKDYVNFQSISDQFEMLQTTVNQPVERNLNSTNDLSDFCRSINALLAIQKPFYLVYRPFEIQSVDMIDLAIHQSIKSFDQMYIAIFYTMQDAKGKITKVSSKLVYQKLPEKGTKEMNVNLNTDGQDLKSRKMATYLMVSIILNLIAIGAGGWAIYKIQNMNNTEIQKMNTEIKNMKGEIQNMKGEIQNMKGEIQNMKGEIQNMKGEIQNMKGEIQNMKGEIQNMKGEIQKK